MVLRIFRHVVADPPPPLPLAPPAPNRTPQRRGALPVQLARHEAAHTAPVRRARCVLRDALRRVHAVHVAVFMAVTEAMSVHVAMTRTQLAVPNLILRTLLRGPLARFRAALPELLRHLAVELLGLVEGLVDLSDGAEDVGRDGGRGWPRGEGWRGSDVGARGDGEGARGCRWAVQRLLHGAVAREALFVVDRVVAGGAGWRERWRRWTDALDARCLEPLAVSREFFRGCGRDLFDSAIVVDGAAALPA